VQSILVRLARACNGEFGPNRLIDHYRECLLPGRMREVKAETAGPKGTIYLVDDEPMLLELASGLLRPLGYDIVTFGDAGEALRCFNGAPEHPVLLITDYAMQPMTGMELIAACRRIDPHQKCLLLSGTVQSEVYADADEKPDAFLPKPFQIRDLMNAVTGIVEG